MEITTLGPDGTYAAYGVKKFFPKAKVRFADTISGVLEAGGNKMVLVLPLENSIEGTVRLSWDGILERGLELCGIFKISVHHVLGTGAKNLKSIKTVVSHPQAISQCRKFLDRHLNGVKIEYVGSTAEAAGKAASDPTVAAIASSYACNIYGLPVLKKGIEDERGNETIFGVVGTGGGMGGDIFPEIEKDEMHIVVTPRQNMPGLLFNILKPFNDFGVDLTRLESRPTRKKLGEYRFLLSFRIGGDVKVEKVLKILRKNYKVDTLGESIFLNDKKI